MRPVHTGQALALAMALLSVPFTGMSAGAAAIAADESEQPPTAFKAALVSRHSNKCIDVDDFSTADHAAIIQWSCHGGGNQQWRLVQKNGGYFSLVARHSNKCLDVDDFSMIDGSAIIQWSCHGGANQDWRLAFS